MYNENKSKGVWRTIDGHRFFVRDGQALGDAMKESGLFEDNEERVIFGYSNDEDMEMHMAMAVAESDIITIKKLLWMAQKVFEESLKIVEGEGSRLQLDEINRILDLK